MVKLSHRAIQQWERYKKISIGKDEFSTAVNLHRFMLRLRRCETALIDEYHPADEMRCPIHFCVGQEAVPAALSLLLRAEDHLFSHHRSHGYFLAKGAPMNALFAELYGRSTGACGGVAGSQDIAFPDVRFYSGAILAGAIGIAAGAAWAEKQKDNGTIAVAGFGEAATDEGVFWEAVNYAGLKKLPLVFVCENNRYSTFSPQTDRHVFDNIHERVETFGVRSEAVFGNDAMLVFNTVQEAVQRARNGDGPTFIEAYTYRWNGHVGPENDDHVGYRPEKEIAFWKRHCPIDLVEEPMYELGLLSSEQRKRLVEEIDEEIADAFTFAKSSPFPDSADWDELNYRSETPLADALLQDVEVEQFDEQQDEAIPGPY